MKKNVFSAKQLLLLIVFGLLLSLIGCATLQKDWEKTIKLDSIWAYEEFIKKHPESDYRIEAEKKLDELRYMEVKKENTAEGYNKFIASNPSSKFINDALEKLREIEKIKWQQANETNTLEAFDEFYELFPKSDKLSELKARFKEKLDDIANKAASSKEDINTGEEGISIPVGQITKAERMSLWSSGNIVKISISQNARIFSNEQTITFYDDPTDELIFHADIVEIAITKKSEPPYGEMCFSKNFGIWNREWNVIAIGPGSYSGVIGYNGGRTYFSGNIYTHMKITNNSIKYSTGTGVVIVDQNGKKQVWKFNL